MMDVVVDGVQDELPQDSKPLPGQEDYYQNLLLCLGYESQALPLADLLKHYHRLDGKWLIASPVHWQASHNDAMMTGTAKELGLTEEESVLWFNQVAEFLKADGFNPVYHDAQTWLFKIDNKPVIKSLSLQSVLHKSFMPILNALDETLYWQRLITELQMYLGSHPLNAQRELALNGLWFWGEGDFQPTIKRAIATDDEVLINCLGQGVSALNSVSNFTKDQLLIIKDTKQLALHQFNKKKINWYWNNCSYSRQARPWWSKLWRV